MGKCVSVFLILLACALPAQVAQAAGFGTIKEVLLSPQNARITAEQEVTVEAGADGRAEARFFLPGNSVDVSLTAEGRGVEDMATARHFSELPPAGHERRDALRNEIIRLEGQKRAAEARLALWTAPGKELSFEDMSKRDAHMQQAVPELYAAVKALEERIRAAKAEYDALPAVGRELTAVTASLSGPAKGVVKLRCSYTAGDCGWQPLYRVTALPDHNLVRVRLEAEISQNSGQDWNAAHVVLVSRAADTRLTPLQLFPWKVENSATVDDNAMPFAAARQDSTPMQKPKALIAGAPLPSPAPAPLFMDRDAFASWELGTRNLREGISRLTIREAEWKVSFLRLARPAMDKRVFLSARCTVEDARAWPQGRATFLLEDAAVGKGNFALRDDKAELFFGVDPRVSVERILDSRQSGKSGVIIGKKRGWEWNWTFKAFNAGSKSVALRIEDAEPESGDKDINISVNSKPEAKKDEKEHLLFWELILPPNKGADINHAVTVSAPADMNVNPGR